MNWKNQWIHKRKFFIGRKVLYPWLPALLAALLLLGMPAAAAPAVLGGIDLHGAGYPSVSTPAPAVLTIEDVAEPDPERTIPLFEPLLPEETDREVYGQPECEVSTNHQFEEDVFDLINAERERLGVNLLEWDDDLAEAARKHSADMACNDYFSHTNLDGLTFDERISAEGYTFTAAGEDLYAGEGVFNDPEQAYYGWVNSPDHYMVMTHPDLAEVGIGYIYAADSRYQGYFSADFGTPE